MRRRLSTSTAGAIMYQLTINYGTMRSVRGGVSSSQLNSAVETVAVSIIAGENRAGKGPTLMSSTSLLSVPTFVRLGSAPPAGRAA